MATSQPGRQDAQQLLPDRPGGQRPVRAARRPADQRRAPTATVATTQYVTPPKS